MRNRKLFSLNIMAGLSYLFSKAGEEFWLLIRNYDSLKWHVAFWAAIIGAAGLVLFLAISFFWPERLKERIGKALHWRKKLAVGRWLLVILFILGVVVLLQYSKYGDIFSGSAIRYSIGVVLIVISGFLLSKEQEIIGFTPLLQAAVCVFAILTAAIDFVGVTSYPFSLGWSEGNRMWDFSVLFGGRLYDYPQDQEIFAYTDFGRQLIGGIPYIFDEVTIWTARLWRGLMDTFLYAVLGWVVFKRTGEKGKQLLFLGLWTYLFINQGPIHPPLVVCAILVALAWGRGYWAAVPLMILSGYFAQVSRFTWMFAPAMWILMLEFSEEKVAKTLGKTWVRPAVLTFAGLTGGVIFPALQGIFIGSSSSATNSGTDLIDTALTQGLLWYRLLPSATYGQGVLPGLLQAVFPIIGVLFFLLITRRWQMHFWKKMVVGGVLLAFLLVGVIVSTKIGGGGDLHNLDMLLIGIVFLAAVAWKAGGKELFVAPERYSLLLQSLLLILVIVPGVRSFREIKPLPIPISEEEQVEALEFIRSQIENVGEDGQVLFMDQRQLLTFGYVEAPLVVEYEKKYLMDQALSGNEQLFRQYYNDLAEGYINLIITEPLHTNLKGSEFVFGEENDAWVTWVSTPTLCFYEEIPTPKIIRKGIGMILLAPKSDTSECAVFLQSVNPE